MDTGRELLSGCPDSLSLGKWLLTHKNSALFRGIVVSLESLKIYIYYLLFIHPTYWCILYFGLNVVGAFADDGGEVYRILEENNLRYRYTLAVREDVGESLSSSWYPSYVPFSVP